MSKRALFVIVALAGLIAGCAHRRETPGQVCPYCGAPLFFVTPGVTTVEDITEFAKSSWLTNRDEIISSGWMHPGAYCPKGDYTARYNFKKQ